MHPVAITAAVFIQLLLNFRATGLIIGSNFSHWVAFPQIAIMHRRSFTKNMLATVGTYCLIDSMLAFDAFGKNMRPLAKNWLLQLNEYCNDLHTNSISALSWQQHLESLFQQVQLQDILRDIDFQNLTRGFKYPELGVATKPVKLPQLTGLPEKTVFVKKIFGMQKDRAIIPHGHSNMASAHYVLQGKMHLRHYQKLYKSNNHLTVVPSIDKVVKAGDNSSISDEKDNVHWFIAESASAFTFDVIMLDLNEKNYDIMNLDMYAAKKDGSGNLIAPILDVETALKKYGKHHH